MLLRSSRCGIARLAMLLRTVALDGPLVPNLLPHAAAEPGSPSQFAVVGRQDAPVEVDRSRLFNGDQSEVRGKATRQLHRAEPDGPS